MKPANFPGRKNDRRKRALANMSKDAKSYETTKARVLPDSVARGIRTKKDHSARGKLRP